MRNKKFPWARLMRFGLNELKLSPTEFWRSTLRELSSAMAPTASPMLRQNLQNLMDTFPDDT